MEITLNLSYSGRVIHLTSSYETSQFSDNCTNYASLQAALDTCSHSHSP
jgi:hypothetical protein